MAQSVDGAVRACLITNPRSGQGGLDLSEPLAVLRANKWDVAVREKQHGGDATTIARSAAASGCEVVVGCGGDGTLSEIVDGLAGSDVAIGVIPGGTVNLWAQELGISTRPRVAAQQLVTAERRRADLGHLEINGRHSRHFLLMAGIGFDGAVIERVSKPLKQRLGGPAVWLAALRAVPAARTVSVTIEMDGMQWSGTLSQIVAGNTRRYGGFTRVTPAARLDDGRLDLCLFTAAGPVQTFRQVATLLIRGHPSLRSAEQYRAARILIQSPVVLPVQVDGGHVPLTRVKAGSTGVTYLLSSRPSAITVLVPSTYDGSLFQQGPAVDAPHPGEMNHLGHGSTESPAAGRVEKKGVGSNQAEKRRWMRVASVAVDTVTGIRVDNGRTLTALVGPATLAKDEFGGHQPMSSFLSALQVGDLIRVKGAVDPDRGLLLARRLKRYAADGKKR